MKPTHPRPEKPRNDKPELWSGVAQCLILAVVSTFALTAPAYAGAMADVICLIVDWFQGNLGKGLATIGVSAAAVGASFGKISWGLALTVVVGVVVMFGATNVLIQTGVIPYGVC